MFNNKPDTEADFCESYKSEILNSSSEEKGSSFSKLLTIVLLLAIVIGLFIIGYKFFTSKTNHKESTFNLPTSIQVSDDDLKVTLEASENLVKEELQPTLPTKKAKSDVVPIVETEKEIVIIEEPTQLIESAKLTESVELSEEPKKVEVIAADISTIVEQAEVHMMKGMQEIPTIKEVKREPDVVATKVVISSPAEVVSMHEVVSSKEEMKEVEVTHISSSKPTPVVNQVNSSAIDQIANSIKLSIAAKEQKSFSKDEYTPVSNKTTNTVKVEKVSNTTPIESKKAPASKEEKNLEIPLSVAPEGLYLEELADLSKQLENEKN